MKGLRGLKVVRLEDMEMSTDGDKERRWSAERRLHATIRRTHWQSDP